MLAGVAMSVASLAQKKAIAGFDCVDEVLLGRDEKRFLYSDDDEDDFSMVLRDLRVVSRQLEMSAVGDEII